jgi:ATP synthase protein I
MSTVDGTGAKRTVLMVVLLQLIATLILAVAFLIGSGSRAGAAALIGGGIGVASSLAMVMFMFRGAGGDPKQIMRSTYRGEAVKLGLTVVLFVVALRSGVAAVPLLVAYIATSFAYWLVLIRS